MSTTDWPALPLAEWKDTYATLHLWAQVIGKVALAQAPPLNHSWGVALHLTPRGLATPLLPFGERSFTMEFDSVDHQLITRTTDGDTPDHRAPTATGCWFLQPGHDAAG